MATLYADSTPARWITASTSWRPQPRTTQEMHANCEWLARRRRHCGLHEASLFARHPIEQGENLPCHAPLLPALVPPSSHTKSSLTAALARERAPPRQAQVHFFGTSAALAHPHALPGPSYLSLVTALLHSPSHMHAALRCIS